MARIHGYHREWGSGSHGLWHGYTDTIESGGVAHTDYGTDTRIGQGVGEWLTRIMARIHG
ncbi:MAG: hypothetical protein SWX82_31440 [Cyanobacteriota bacterium]|nr:hypothetical protein [Cyanobacteriota bacterium]